MYISPLTVGVPMAVGNISKTLPPYIKSDAPLSRDACFTWQKAQKGTHLWEFGDCRSVLVIANNEKPTDHIIFSTDKGLTCQVYKFMEEEMNIQSIVQYFTVPHLFLQESSHSSGIPVESCRNPVIPAEFHWNLQECHSNQAE
jgi:hypothetical protein